MKNMKENKSQQGFTIVEIMIATTILSVMLVLVTTMIIGIGKLYSKGINLNRIQDNARTINDEVSQHLQLEGTGPIPAASPDGNTLAICVGNTRYSFVKNLRLGPNDSSHSVHVLWRDDNPNTGSCSVPNSFLSTEVPQNGASNPSKNGVELMGANTRITEFTITATSPYTVQVGLVYGDDDLFTGSGMSVTCNGGVGSQFCATAQLTSTVAKRMLN